MVVDIEQEQQQQQQQTPTSTLKKPTKTNDYFIYNHQLIMDEARKKLIIEQEAKNIILIDACLSEKTTIKQENTHTQNLNKTKTNSTRSSMSNLADTELKYSQVQEQKLKKHSSFDPVARLQTGTAHTELDKAKNETTNKSQTDPEYHDTPNEAAHLASFQPSNSLQKSQYFRSFRSASRRFFGLNQNSNNNNKKPSSNENESNKMGKSLNSSYLNRSFKNLSSLKKLVGSNSSPTEQLSSKPAEKKDASFRSFVSKSQTDLSRKFSDDLQDFPSSRSRHKVFNRNIINRSMINPRREGFLTSNSSWLYFNFKSY